MPPTSHIRNLRQALATCRRALEEFESALQGFEEVPEENEEAPERSLNGHLNRQNLRLLSPSEVCQELGEESAVVQQRLRSGEIPSLKLGRTLKVRQPDLKEYIKGQRGDHPPGEKNGLAGTEVRSPLGNG